MIITLCGSTRFPDAFDLAAMHLTLTGHIVLTVGLHSHADRPEGSRFLTSDSDLNNNVKTRLDDLHKRKIDLADAIYVINVGGYIGESTENEITYAKRAGKGIYWMFPTKL